jgi:hypothetical protein
MIERPQSPPASRPEITSPGVNIQDVEHDARPETRVDNAGVRVKPRVKRPEDTEPDPEKEHEKAPDAEARFNADVAKLPPD